MTSPASMVTPTPLEAEYKEQVRQTVRENRDNRPSSGRTGGRSGQQAGSPGDVVTLSSGYSDAPKASALQRSQPVTSAEKQALHVQFSVYG